MEDEKMKVGGMAVNVDFASLYPNVTGGDVVSKKTVDDILEDMMHRSRMVKLKEFVDKLD